MKKCLRASVPAVLVTLMALTAPEVALAGKNGGGNNGPKSNTNSDGTETKTTYVPQNASVKKPKSGKVTVKEFTIKKTTDKASPN